MEFKKDKLLVKISDTRDEMGRVSAKDIHDCILEMLKEKEELNIVFAAAPSQNDMLFRYNQIFQIVASFSFRCQLSQQSCLNG